MFKIFSPENRVVYEKITVKPERPQNGNKTQGRKHAISMPDDYGKNEETHSEYLKLIIVHISKK